jgi:CrcB protein
MNKLLLIGLGGFLGSMSRFALGGWVHRMKSGWAFPLETLIVNVAGCLVIGILAGMSESRGVFSDTTRAFLFAGVLGGFTTFSAFGYETFLLMRDGQLATAAWSTCFQMALGLGGVWLGHALARLGG